MHDFSFYRIKIAQTRYIAGFGKMGWIAGDKIANDNFLADSPLAGQETAIIEHMNADHVESMLAYCKHFNKITATHAQMLGIDSGGFDVKVDMPNTNLQAGTYTKTIRFSFDQPIHDAQSARLALVGMSKAAKL
jgi:putative heme iron utilization protein